jgi:HEAT repeat protein
VLPLLDDPDSTVRMGIARKIGEVGSPAVEPLRSVIDNGSEQAALAAVVGLTLAGHDGHVELVLLAHSHPNKKVQTLANLALGRAPDADKH